MTPPSLPRAVRALPVVVALVAFAVAGGAVARPDKPLPGELYKFAPGDVVESHASAAGHFRLHFTRNGPHSVLSLDADTSGVPDHVENLAKTYEQVLAFYTSLGFAPPPPDGTAGGDSRFDVYLLDFAGKADGHFAQETCTGDKCAGYMVQENDFSGYNYPSVAYANRILASHEFFHAVQAGYDAKQGGILSEGSAVWATEQFDPSLQDFEQFLPGFLKHPDRSLDKPMLGPVDAFSYGSALFFQFLSERFGATSVLQLWKDCQDGAQGVANPGWFAALAALLKRDHKTTFADEYTTFVAWNLLTGAWADPSRGYAKAANYPKVAPVAAALPYRDDDLRVFYASSQYLRFAPKGRTHLTVALAEKTDPSALRVGLIARIGDGFSPWQWSTHVPAKAVPPIDVATADEVFVVVVNTAQGGESIRGSLCVGTLDEVAGCLPAPVVDAAADAAGDGGRAAAETAAAGDQAADGPTQTATPPKTASDGGCKATGGTAFGGWWLALAAAAAVAMRRRSASRQV